MRDYEQLLIITPHDSQALNNYGATLSKLERFEEALQALTAAIEFSPETEHFRLHRARIFMKLADIANAREDMLAVADRRKDAYGKFLLALFDIRTGNREAYLNICRNMLEELSEVAIKPDDGCNVPDDVLTIWAISLGANAVPSYIKSFELARKRLEMDKNNLRCQRVMGALLFRSGKFPEAKQYLTNLVQTDETLANLDDNYFNLTFMRYFMAMCQYKLGSVEVSHEWLANANSACERLLSLDTLLFPPRLELEMIRDEANALINAKK